MTNAKWKARKFSSGPIDRDIKNPRVENQPIPETGTRVDFDDSQWKPAREYTEQEVDPKQPYFENDFKGANSSGLMTSPRQHGDFPACGAAARRMGNLDWITRTGTTSCPRDRRNARVGSHVLAVGLCPTC